MENRYERMRVDELKAAREACPLAYLPVGSLEYHGLHIPVGFDALHAHECCLAASRQTGGVVLPPLFWGTQGHEGFPGSLLISEETLVRLTREILALLERQGYRLIVICTGHHPFVQGAVLARAAAEHMTGPGECETRPESSLVLAVSPFDYGDRAVDHAGAIETSLGLALFPDLIRMEAQQAGADAFYGVGANWPEASADAGRTRFETAVEGIVTQVTSALAQLPQPPGA
jgi:creatinine amidohydrolase